MKSFLFASGLLATILFAAQARAELQNTKEFDSKWDDYVARASGPNFKLQPNCKPLKYEPPIGTSYKGTVLMLPGFTNCPEEYYQLGEVLKNAGYEVLLVDLPGHGHMRLPDESDDLSAMPTSKDEYDSFAQEMNDLVKLARPGKKFLIGHSAGGTIATRALELNPTLYNRAVLFAPFYDIAGKAADIPNPTLYALGNLTWYWFTGLKKSDTCQDQIVAGKAGEGYCSLKFSNMAAVRDLGKEAMENADLLQTPIQVLGVVADNSSNNPDTIKLFEKLFNRENDLCFYKDAPHPLLDPLIWSKSVWVQSILVNLPRYLDGIAYPTEGQSPELDHPPYCN